jgi:hypothetical protein
MIIHRGIVTRQRLSEPQEAHKAATRRESHKRKRMKKERTLTVEEGVRLTTLRKSRARNNGKKANRRKDAVDAAPRQGIIHPRVGEKQR